MVLLCERLKEVLRFVLFRCLNKRSVADVEVGYSSEPSHNILGSQVSHCSTTLSFMLYTEGINGMRVQGSSDNRVCSHILGVQCVRQ